MLELFDVIRVLTGRLHDILIDLPTTNIRHALRKIKSPSADC